MLVLFREQLSVQKRLRFVLDEAGGRKAAPGGFVLREVTISSTNTCHSVTTSKYSFIFPLMGEDGLTSFLFWITPIEKDMPNEEVKEER